MAWPLKSLLIAAILITSFNSLNGRTSTWGKKTPITTTEPEDPDMQAIRFGAILPHTSLITVSRSYNKKITDSLDTLTKGRNAKFNFAKYKKYLKPLIVPLPLDPSPTVVLNALCNQMLPANVTAILYLTNAEVYGSNAASAQYLLQLTGYLGIPVIAWNADNIGLEKGLGSNYGESYYYAGCLWEMEHEAFLHPISSLSMWPEVDGPPSCLKSFPEVGGPGRGGRPLTPQGVLPPNWGGTEQICTVNCMVFKANDRHKNLALHRDELRGPGSVVTVDQDCIPSVEVTGQFVDPPYCFRCGAISIISVEREFFPGETYGGRDQNKGSSVQKHDTRKSEFIGSSSRLVNCDEDFCETERHRLWGSHTSYWTSTIKRRDLPEAVNGGP
ncbi:uncharacterized protein TNCV_4644981 [Trichonephila clavipes]|nr:uncharacterized protein TNCV_4644981 [Trichonephila clavipes]